MLSQNKKVSVLEVWIIMELEDYNDCFSHDLPDTDKKMIGRVFGVYMTLG
jgi:hypothetical protein